MAEEILNRVANSKLITFNLEDYYEDGDRIAIDIAQWLEEGIVLREKSFRDTVRAHSWEQYRGKFVALHCSTHAIVPAWAFMLLTSQLIGIAKKTVQGSLETLETVLFVDRLSKLDVSPYVDKPIIIKGCSQRPVPENAYLLLIEKLQPVVRSLLFGEACSSVPLYKKAK